MSSQSRLVSQTRDTGQTQSGPGARSWLMRTLAVAAATSVVVGVWSTQDGTSPTIRQSAISAPAPEVATAESQTSPVLSAAETISVPPNALPRPPELDEPARPDRFERFVVERGDTLYDVSVVYGVSIEDLLRFNPALGNGSRIDAGQLVMIPIFAP